MDAHDHLATQPLRTPADTRVLWTVLLLKLGYGIVESVGGFLASSQSLKAHALDFFGDGTIILLAVMAIKWGPIWHARAALIQGVFLVIIGILVLAATAYRIFFFQRPEADLMSIFAFGALIINMICAVILLKHRDGGATVGAVFFSSFNDAFGSVAVMVAAVLVWGTASQGPDLMIAAGITGILLQSASDTIANARRKLTSPRA